MMLQHQVDLPGGRFVPTGIPCRTSFGKFNPVVQRGRNIRGRTPSQLCANNDDCTPLLSISHPLGLVGMGLLCTGLLEICPPAVASTVLHQEPANALSWPTWVIHISSVIEWFTAMWLVWSYAEVTQKPEWKGLTWGMLPLFAGALTACTWHFFYNSPDLEFLVAIQAFLTVFGNFTCWIAAYRIYQAYQPAEEST